MAPRKTADGSSNDINMLLICILSSSLIVFDVVFLVVSHQIDWKRRPCSPTNYVILKFTLKGFFTSYLPLGPPLALNLRATSSLKASEANASSLLCGDKQMCLGWGRWAHQGVHSRSPAFKADVSTLRCARTLTPVRSAYSIQCYMCHCFSPLRHDGCGVPSLLEFTVRRQLDGYEDDTKR
jgi:hypothetical protein